MHVERAEGMIHATGFSQESRKSWPWCITFALQQGACRRRVSQSQLVMTFPSGSDTNIIHEQSIREMQHLTLYVSYVSYVSTCIIQVPTHTHYLKVLLVTFFLARAKLHAWIFHHFPASFNVQLGGGFKHFLFSPLFGEDFPFD